MSDSTAAVQFLPERTAQKFVRFAYHRAEIEVDETRERTQVYRVVDNSLSLPGLSVWRFSEEDAWQDAMERLRGMRPQL